MEMQQVRYFLTLCETLNFTRAADLCNVAQPSLTRAIKQLEVELGGPLFHRERANTHLTELGRTVRPFLQQVREQADEARREAREVMQAKKAPLRLGLMCTIAPTLLLDLVRAVGQNHPGIRLKIIDASAQQLQSKLLSGDLDVAIYAMPEPRDERLHYLALYREQFVIAVSERNALAQLNAVRVKDLGREPYLSRVNCEYHAPALVTFHEHGATGPIVYESERDDWILAMAAAGLGYTFIPELCASHPGVIARPLIEPEFWREVALITVRGRPHSAAVGALVSEATRTRWTR
jgi:LysR family hydrogen peroxide-inducible transcriptional activator